MTSLPITSVLVLKGRMSTIYLNVTEDVCLASYGKFHPFNCPMSLKVSVPRGQEEATLVALHVDKLPRETRDMP